jgi:acyl-CoA reductase-like NAD-dependent aldehyde dehydrogenase
MLPQLVEQVAQLKVGAGWEADVDIGPLISTESKARVLSIVDQAVEQGATVLLDGRKVDVPGLPLGNFVGPTVLQVPDTTNVAYTQEIFGPVLTVLAVDSLEEAIHIINSNPYGNGCALFTSSGAAARKFTTEVEAGQVGINIPIPVPLPMFSFTGNKVSYTRYDPPHSDLFPVVFLHSYLLCACTTLTPRVLFSFVAGILRRKRLELLWRGRSALLHATPDRLDQLALPGS